MLDIALLGTGGMMPLPNRFLTSMLARHEGRLMMIDCGEGTQVTLKMLGWGFKNIDIICFTHYHADHISGLPGLLLTIGNSERHEPIHIVGPSGLNHIVRSLLVIAQGLPFDIILHELPEKHNEEDLVFDKYHLKYLVMDHRITCFGYKIIVRRKGRFDVDRAKSLGLPVNYWSTLQKGELVNYNGKEYTPDMVLGPERKPIQVCYCTDSRPVNGLADFARGSDLFISEGIYGDDEKRDKAIAYKHTTFREAAETAKQAEVKELWLTHYSPSVINPKEHVQAVREVFPNTIAAHDRMTKSIKFEDE